MINRSPVPEKILPSQLLLRTEGSCNLDPGHLLDVWVRQRQRFVAVLRRFGPDDWPEDLSEAGKYGQSAGFGQR